MAVFPRSPAWLLLLLLAAEALGVGEDPVVVAAPKWDCSVDSRDPAQVIWRTKLDGNSGALAAGNGTVLVGSRDNNANSCSMNALDTAGRVRWRARYPCLESRIHDLGQPLECRACIDGGRAYYMSNRGEIVCVDLAGSRPDGAAGGAGDAPIVWKIDLMRELGVYKRDASDVGNPLPSPLVIGDLVFCVTAHGAPPEGARADPKPPSFLALDKRTGKVAWSSNAPGANIVFSQWASPVAAVVDGVTQVIFPGGDGVLYGFEPATGRPLWELDCNRLGARDRFREEIAYTHLIEARCGFVATPTVHGTMLYAALNENYECPVAHPLLAVDLAAADGQPKIAWQFDAPAFKGTYHAPAVDGGLVFVTGDDCRLFALEEKTGREIWQAELEDGERNLCAGLVIHEGRVYAGAESTISVFEVSREKKCLGQYEFHEIYIATPDFAGDAMLVAAGEYAVAVRLPPGK